jgi:hypothetical protein
MTRVRSQTRPSAADVSNLDPFGGSPYASLSVLPEVVELLTSVGGHSPGLGPSKWDSLQLGRSLMETV